MDDKELIERFVRISRNPGHIDIDVNTVGWEGPHTPVDDWKHGARLSIDASSDQIDIEIKRILENKRFFNVCTMCHERKPVGWMHDRDTCHGCAEKHLWIVH